MVKKLLALITALVVLAAFVPCAFAVEGESTLTVYMDEDFEKALNSENNYVIENWGSHSVSGAKNKWPYATTKILTGSTGSANATKYYGTGQFGEMFYRPATATGEQGGRKSFASAETVVVDFRFAPSAASFNVMLYNGDSSKTLYANLVFNGFVSDNWYYVRCVIDDVNNTTNVYLSSDGWNSMSHIATVVSNGDSNGTATVTKYTQGYVPRFDSATKYFAKDGISGIIITNLNGLDDIKIYKGGAAPTATVNVAAEEGTYTASYIYSDIDGEAQGATAIQWESSVNGTDNWTAIEGETAAEFTPASDFEGYIRAVVTPKSSRYPVEGTPVASDAIEIAPEIPELVIDNSTGVYKAEVNLEGLEKDNLWGILAVYDGGALVEAKIKKNITVTDGAAQFSITGDEQVSGLTAPSARFFLWEADVLVPVRTFE